MEIKTQLLHLLADARIHSGAKLAAALGVSRTAVWKQLKSFLKYGLEVHAIRGKGYQLSRPIEFYDEGKIRSVVSRNSCRLLNKLEVFHEIESTNRHLLNKLALHNIHGHAVLAEYQMAGRGRRNRSWVSPLGSGICLSLGWRFEPQPASMTALSLASGVAVVDALNRLGIESAGLKWPNDIFCHGRKLGGILIEIRGENEGPCDVVIGIGINMDLPESAVQSISQPVTDLTETGKKSLSRNETAGVIISEVTAMLAKFNMQGFKGFIARWRELDLCSGKDANLHVANKVLSGKVLGIDDNGMLLMSIDGEIRKFNSGDLSLRISS